ncbi:MAG TPA: tripartite tricarboxylate transporter substrate binding protein [Burkholderiales bacterium]|nr:tripartite tricarboxylate transporter substrate binding protein [Burkholderiales bacterium]
MQRILAWLLLLALPLGAAAQSFPNKAVRVVVPFPAGGAADSIARIVTERMSNKWGQPVLVENRAGAGGNVGADAVYRADPDGYTLLSSPPGPLSINHNLYKELSFEPGRFVPITVLCLSPNVISARNELPVGSVKELVAYAKANPGKVSYASQGNGSTSHLSAAMLASMAGLQLLHVPYKGEAPALTDLAGGRVDIFIGNLFAALKLAQGGRIKLLGVASEKRNAVAPDLPTVSEAGVPGFLSSAWFALVAPPQTPAAVAREINAAAVEALRSDDVRKKLLALGAEPVGGTTAETAAFIKDETERWKKVIKDANVTLAN